MNKKNKTVPEQTSAQAFSWLIRLMAVSAGITVANIYYNQPILMDIASEFHTSESRAGLVSALSQIGYGFGLFFITPLGDKFNKKKLILCLQILLVATLGLVFLTTSLVQVWLLSILISFFSVSVQVIMPLAAGLSSENRGKNVGTIFTGVLIGILAARVFSGGVADAFGWRYVYLISAVAVGMSTLLLSCYLPNSTRTFSGNYPRLILSTLQQFGRFSLLRRLSFIGMLQFGLFCSLWTTLTFHLSGSPFYFRSSTIGLFGLVAIAGALIAPFMGKKADKGNVNNLRFMAIGVTILSILILFFFKNSIIAMVLGVFLLDIGAQSLQVTNTALLYTLDESVHSRVNTIYMTLFFSGGALGTLVGITLWQWGGWSMVCIQMLCFALGVVLLLLKERATLKRRY